MSGRSGLTIAVEWPQDESWVNVDYPAYVLASPLMVGLTFIPVKLSDWIMVAAILCGPVLAVQAQKWIEVFRENKTKRVNTFKRLMATRGAPLSWTHVEALNSIELEFSDRGKKDEQVRRRWREYHDHLNSLNPDPEKQKEQLDRWTERKDELLAQLLCDMGSAVGYNFDIVQIRRGIYSPMGHANYEFETQAIRRLLIDLLVGKRALPMDVRSLPAMQTPGETTASIEPSKKPSLQDARMPP